MGVPKSIQKPVLSTSWFDELPDGVQYIIWKKVYSSEVVPRFQHKDWWFHTVKARSESWLGYIDAETSHHFPSDHGFFSYGQSVDNKQ
jgi:hypothetical protein